MKELVQFLDELLTEVRLVKKRRVPASVRSKRRRYYKRHRSQIKRRQKRYRRKPRTKRLAKRRTKLRKRFHMKPGSRRRLQMLSTDIVKQIQESMKKKVSDYEIEDIGMEGSQYFQGRGVSHSKWDEVVVGIGNNQKEAFEDALEQIAMSDWEISPELEKEVENADDLQNVVVTMHVEGSINPSTNELDAVAVQGEVDLRNVTSAEAVVKKGATIQVSHSGFNGEDVAMEIEDALEGEGIKLGEKTKKELEHEGRMMNEHEMHYHVAVFLKGEGEKSMPDESVDHPMMKELEDLKAMGAESATEESSLVKALGLVESVSKELDEGFTTMAEARKTRAKLVEARVVFNEEDMTADPLKYLPDASAADGIDEEFASFINEQAFGKKKLTVEEKSVKSDLKTMAEDAARLKKAVISGATDLEEAKEITDRMVAYLDKATRKLVIEDEMDMPIGGSGQGSKEGMRIGDKKTEAKLLGTYTKDLNRVVSLESVVSEEKIKLWKRSENYSGEDMSDYYVGPGTSRDADVLQQSNFASALEMLGGEDGEKVIVGRFGHWAVGWIEQIFVHKDAKDKVEILQSIADKMADYPVLDDDDFYERENQELEDTFEGNKGQFVSSLAEVLGIEPDATQEKDLEQIAKFILQWSNGYFGLQDAWVDPGAVKRHWSTHDWADLEHSVKSPLVADLKAKLGVRGESVEVLGEADPSLQPPKRWFNKMLKRVKGDNKPAIVGSIWSKLPVEKKKEIRGREGKTYGPAESVAEAKGKWTIVDWAGNFAFQKGGHQGSGHLHGPEQTFDSFEDAEEFLSTKLGDSYETDRGEYDIIPYKGSRESRYLDPKDPRAGRKPVESVEEVKEIEGKKVVKSGTYRGKKWHIVQTNSGQMGSPVDYKMVVPGVFSSDFFKSIEPWSIKREMAQAKSFIDDSLGKSDAVTESSRDSKEAALAEKLQDQDAVKKAAEEVFGINKWQNFGDVNPAVHGGQWIKFDGKNFEVVTTDLGSEAGYPGSGEEGEDTVLIRSTQVDLDRLAKDGPDVISFTDAAQPASLGESLIWLLTGWVSYYGGDTDEATVDSENLESEYARVMKGWGITSEDKTWSRVEDLRTAQETGIGGDMSIPLPGADPKKKMGEAAERKPVQHEVTITLTLKEAAEALGYLSGRDAWKIQNEYLDADSWDDVYHGGYSAKDAQHMDVKGMDDVEKIFPGAVAVAAEAAERDGYAAAIGNARRDAIKDAFEKIEVVGEYQSGDGDMIGVKSAGIKSCEVDTPKDKVTLVINNPEHLINDLVAGVGFFSTELDPYTKASKEDIKAGIISNAHNYFDVYGERRPDGELDSRFSPDIDDTFMAEEVKYHIGEMTDADIAEAVIEAVDEGRLDDEKEAIKLAAKFAKKSVKEVGKAVAAAHGASAEKHTARAGAAGSMEDEPVESIQTEAIAQFRWKKTGNGNLEITALDPENLEPEQAWEDALEHLFANSELGPVLPEEIGALTDAPIIGDVERDDHGDIKETHDIWWYPEYETKNPIAELKEKGTVVFTKAPDDKGGKKEEAVAEVTSPKDAEHPDGPFKDVSGGGVSVDDVKKAIELVRQGGFGQLKMYGGPVSHQLAHSLQIYKDRGEFNPSSPDALADAIGCLQQAAYEIKGVDVKESAVGEAIGKLSPMVNHYLVTALWSSTDNSTPQGGEPLDKNYDVSDIAEESVEKAKKDCEEFYKQAEIILGKNGDEITSLDDEQLGHDFWLSRNGHGAGFFDAEYLDEEMQDALQDLAKGFGEVNPYIADIGEESGKIFIESFDLDATTLSESIECHGYVAKKAEKQDQVGQVAFDVMDPSGKKIAVLYATDDADMKEKIKALVPKETDRLLHSKGEPLVDQK